MYEIYPVYKYGFKYSWSRWDIYFGINRTVCRVGALSVARPMSPTLKPKNSGRYIMILEYSYQLDVWELSAILVGGTSRVLCGAKYYTDGSHL